MQRFHKLGRKAGWLSTASAASVLAAGLLAAGAAHAEVPNNSLNPNAPPTLADPDAVNGIGIVYADYGPLGGGVCTATLINPRTVIFAAHCVNDDAETNYGYGNGGTPLAVGFKGDARAGLINWLGSRSSSYIDQTYNIDRVFYDARSLDQPAGGFYEADVAIGVLDAPTRGVPTWAMLFSPLTGEEDLHVTIGGYGRSGTGTTGQSQGVDYRRRAGENMIGALAAIDDVNLWLFGDGSQSGLGQNLYLVDFDDPAGTSPYDFNIFGNDVALPGEGLTAQGDSGGALILDRAFDIPVIAGVLSLGTRYYGAQPSASYGTTAGYQPLYLFWDYVVANNPYKYVTAKSGDGDWFDAAHWTQMMDPNYKIIVDGQLQTGLPGTPAAGVGGQGGEWGAICFLDDCLDASELAEYNHGAQPQPVSDGTPAPTSQSGSNRAIVGRGDLVVGLNDALDASAAVPTGSTSTRSAVVTAPGASAPFEYVAGGPGSTGFVPDNTAGSIADDIRPAYYDVTLTTAGRTRLNNGGAVIDRLLIGASGAVLDIGENGYLASLIDTTVTAGELNVDGRFDTFEMLLMGGVLSGRGVVDPTVLTSIMGSIAPGGMGQVGELTVIGDVVMTSGSRLFIDIAGSTSDRLTLVADPAQGTTGEISVGGLLGINFVAAPTYGTTYTIITAPGGVSGGFDGMVDLPGVLTPTLQYTNNAVRVTLDAASFAAFIDPSSPSQAAIGGLLDQSRGASYAALSPIYTQVDLMEGAQLGAALESLAPYTALSAASQGASQTETFQAVVSDRLAMRRDGSHTGLTLIGKGIQVAAMNDELAPIVAAAMAAAQDEASARPAWATGWREGVAAFLAAGGSQGEARSLRGVTPIGTDRDDQDAWYVTGGLERTVDALTVGGSLGYADGTSEYAASLGRTDTRQIQATAYATMRGSRGGFLGGYVGYGWLDVESERNVVLGGTTLRAEGETDGTVLSAGFEVGDEINTRQGIAIIPSFGLNAYKVSLDGYDETGSAVAMSIGDVDYDSLQGFMGVRFEGEVRTRDWSIRPALGLRAVTAISGDSEGVSAGFVAGSGPFADFAGPTRDKGWGEVSGSVVIAGPRADLTLQAASVFERDDLDYQTYRATVSMKF